MKKVLIALAATALAFAACDPEQKTDPTVEVSMSSFGFYAGTNPSLKDDFVVTEPSNEIRISLPYGTDEAVLKGLVPTFAVTEGATVTVDGEAVESGVTSVDFSYPVEFLVSVNSNSNAQYTVTVSISGPAKWAKKAVSEAAFKSELALAMSPVKEELYMFGYLEDLSEDEMSFPLMVKYADGSVAEAAGVLDRVEAKYIAANCNKDGIPYSLFYDNTNKKMRVLKVSGGSATEVGDPSALLPNTGNSVGSSAIVPVSENDIWVFLMNNRANADVGVIKRGLNVCHYDGNTWTQNVTIPDWPAGDATYIIQTKWVEGIPYVFILDFTAAKFFVYKYENGSWATVCNGVQPLQTDGNTPISSAHYKYSVMNFDVASNGDVYLMASADFETGNDDNQIGVVKYDIAKKECTLVGGIYKKVTVSQCRYISMALDSNDIPYLVYGNSFLEGQPSCVTYIDQKAKIWAEPVALTTEKTEGIDIRFSDNGIGYIAYINDTTRQAEVWTNE